MRLQQKFALLFALLGIIAAISVAVAVWAVRFLERELAWPLQSIEEVMSSLHDMKRAVENESASIGFVRGPIGSDGSTGDFRSLKAREQFQQAQVRMHSAFDELAETQSYLMRSGVSTARNLGDRVTAIDEAADKWFDSGAAEDRALLGRELAATHELIERVEGRILSDAGLAVAHGQRLRTLVLGLVVVSTIIVVLSGVLALILFRRWILRPVQALRVAAERIGAGDLAHRLDVVGCDELAQLSGEVNHMASMLGQMQEERVERERLAAVGEMARRIVHNLRKPLSAIRALAETTRDELPPTSELVGVQDRIIRAVDRFEEWLRDVLKASSPLTLTIEEVEVRPWLARVLEAHRPEADARHVQLELNDAAAPKRARFDPRHLGHALSAIISNAIDFTPEGTAVRVDVTSEGGGWSIRVSDFGPGIPEQFAEEAFRPYVTTRSGGTGIGLAVAKRVMEQHGGTVSVVPCSERPAGAVGAVLELRLRDAQLANNGQIGDGIGQNPGH